MTASESAWVLGINRTQDASACLLDKQHVLWAIQKERLTRKKHHWGKLRDVPDIYLARLPKLSQPLDLIVECYSSDSEIENLALYHAELIEHIPFREVPRIELISHHFAHLWSALWPSGLEQAAVMIIDFMGSPIDQVTEEWTRSPGARGTDVEVASFYSCRNGCIDCIGKQIWNRDRGAGVGLGFFYQAPTQTLFPGEGNEGKVMGLAAYGNPHDLKMPPLEVAAGEVFIPEDWISLFRNTAQFSAVDPTASSFNDSARIAAAGQFAFELALSKVAAWLHAETGIDSLCFAGGAALNCVANNRIRIHGPFKRLFIPPAPGDAGTALGCALYGLARTNADRSTFHWQHDFLGPRQDETSVHDVVKGSEGLLCHPMADPIVELADLLCVGKVIGLVRGRSEFGPRSLGHRSIIADATNPGIREWINANIKGREWFRPLAPMVLAEDAELYFDLDVDSPHMAYACDVRAAARRFLPAVTHVDGTARVQTVNPSIDRFAYELLKAVKRRTGHGVLLNTSFNGKDEPIVETLNEALACLCKSELHAVAYPPYLITKNTGWTTSTLRRPTLRHRLHIGC